MMFEVTGVSNPLHCERYRARKTGAWVLVTWNGGDHRRGEIRLISLGSPDLDDGHSKQEILAYAWQHALEGWR